MQDKERLVEFKIIHNCMTGDYWSFRALELYYNLSTIICIWSWSMQCFPSKWFAGISCGDTCKDQFNAGTEGTIHQDISRHEFSAIRFDNILLHSDNEGQKRYVLIVRVVMISSDYHTHVASFTNKV